MPKQEYLLDLLHGQYDEMLKPLTYCIVHLYHVKEDVAAQETDSEETHYEDMRGLTTCPKREPHH
jgi:hypothetical protein